MARWLFKQEPSCYSLSHLEQDQETLWDGVANPQALKHMRAMQPGDLGFFYHTGDEKAIVGIMEVIAAPEPNPENEKLVAVRVRYVKSLSKPVSLAEIKADPSFAEWELVRQARLSVMPVSDQIWQQILQMSGEVTLPRGKYK